MESPNTKRKRQTPRPLAFRLTTASTGLRTTPRTPMPTAPATTNPTDDRRPPRETAKSASARVDSWLDDVMCQSPDLSQLLSPSPTDKITARETRRQHVTSTGASEHAVPQLSTATGNRNMSPSKANQARILDKRAAEGLLSSYPGRDTSQLAVPPVSGMSPRAPLSPRGCNAGPKQADIKDLKRSENATPECRKMEDNSANDGCRPGDGHMPAENNKAGTSRHGRDLEVRNLSPLVTPFRKGRRPKVRRTASYYDGDILHGEDTGGSSSAGQERVVDTGNKTTDMSAIES